MFIRTVGSEIRVDIVDPHNSALPDALSKAKALAEYAHLHGQDLGEVDLVAKIGNRFATLHLQDEKTRKKVAAANDLGTLDLLFSEA
jgi:hypothetical protein